MVVKFKNGQTTITLTNAETRQFLSSIAAVEVVRDAIKHQVDFESGESVQCPHCKWGFFPSVIEQHIREKHGAR